MSHCSYLLFVIAQGTGEAGSGEKTFWDEYIMNMDDDSWLLGSGQFAQVRKCIHIATNKTYAAKVMDQTQMSKEDYDALFVEVQVMKLVGICMLCQREFEVTSRLSSTARPPELGWLSELLPG